MDLPDALLAKRLTQEDRDRVHLALLDDGPARAVVLGLGTASVGTLALGWTAGGPVWPWVGVLSVPALAWVALRVAARLGGRTVEVVVERDSVTLGTERRSLRELRAVRLQGASLVLDHPDGPVTVEITGEDEDVRVALRDWLDACRSRAS